MCWSILVWCVFGFIVGAVARFAVPGEDPMGCVGTVALGIAGSVMGGFLGWLVFGEPYAPAQFIGALIGAVIVLLLYRRFFSRRMY